MEIHISFIGGIWTGQFFFESLKQAKIISVLSMNKFGLPSGKKLEDGPQNEEIVYLTEDSIDLVLEVEFKILYLKDCTLLKRVKDLIFVLRFHPGTIYDIKNIFEFLTKDCMGLIFFFSLLKRQTSSDLEPLNLWSYFLDNFSKYHDEKINNFPIILGFNKENFNGTFDSDPNLKELMELHRNGFIHPKEINDSCNKNNFPYFTISTHTGEKIAVAFQTLIQLILDKMGGHNGFVS